MSADTVHPLAGGPGPESLLVHVPRLVAANAMCGRSSSAPGSTSCSPTTRTRTGWGRSAARAGLDPNHYLAASFLHRDGAVWTTDKDGLIMGLLAVEATARAGRDPGDQCRAL